jgi:hypothetical protein
MGGGTQTGRKKCRILTNLLSLCDRFVLSGPLGHLQRYAPRGKALEVLQYTCGRARTLALHLQQDRAPRKAVRVSGLKVVGERILVIGEVLHPLRPVFRRNTTGNGPRAVYQEASMPLELPELF